MSRRKAAATRKAQRARSGPATAAPLPASAPRGGQGRSKRPDAAGASAVEPEALVVTHSFDSGQGDEPYTATVRFSGRRVGIGWAARPEDQFVHEETVGGVVPGSGPVSISAWVYGLQPGEWTVSAEVVREPVGGRRSVEGRRASKAEPIPRAAWSWRRWALSPGPTAALKTRWAPLAPFARIPAVVPGSWTALVGLGILVGFLVQTALLAQEKVSVSGSLSVSLLAVGGGLVGAKLWDAVLHPGPWRQSLRHGWSVDGFVVVGAVVATAALLAFNLPIGIFLDASTPALFVGVAIGRLGCFLTGCCAGRCTRSRWAVWSSDRRVGARRIPTQLLESATGLVIAIAAGLLVSGEVLPVHGITFALAAAAYLLIRQFLLRLRAESRRFSWRRSSQPFPQGS